MHNTDHERRIEAIKQRAHGRWTAILREFGADMRLLKGRNLPCPMCGGVDRFQYTDKFGEGNYHCRGCGAGGGFKLLKALTGWNFATAVRKVEAFVDPLSAVARSPSGDHSAERMRQLAQRLWNEAQPIVDGDQASRYLRGRGLHLAAFPQALRCHPALSYYEADDNGKPRLRAKYPSLLARVQDANGNLLTLHRTYLKDGQKAPVGCPRKLLSAGINGAAVRLFEATEHLSVAEGLENALAVHLGTGQPLWSALNAANLEKLWIPESVRQVSIYADNDADSSFAGQASAYVLARRLARERLPDGSVRQVQVFVPRRAGADWRDVWEQHQSRTRVTTVPRGMRPRSRRPQAATA